MIPAAVQYVYQFGDGRAEGDPARPDILGGKGAGLAAMCRAGFAVPPGFTISAECCELIQTLQGQWPPDLREQVLSALRSLEQSTGRTFGQGPRPLLVAVRSGAAVSMPGMMDTILNCGLHPELAGSHATRDGFWRDYADHVRMFAASVAGLTLTSDGGTDPQAICRQYISQYETALGRPFPTDPVESLFECIRAVFESWNSPRAVAYRAHRGVRGAVGTAVNVQMMFPSERSGVLFTADPNNPASGEMIVEGSWGLGEAVVSGAVTPDIYVLDAATFQVKQTTPGARPVRELAPNELAPNEPACDEPTHDEPALDERQLRELAALGKQVADYFGKPSDIEWGLADGKFALLQARPIRALETAAEVERLRLEEIERLKRLASPQRVVWIAHNLGETLIDPTPLTWDVVRGFMSRGGGYGRLYELVGQRMDGPREHGFLELICGRIYVDPRRAARFFHPQLPLEYDVDQLLRDPATIEGPPTRLDIERADPLFFLRLPRWAWSLGRAWWIARRQCRDADLRFDRQALPKLQDFLAGTAGFSLAEAGTAELLKELDRRLEFVLHQFAAESLLPGYFGGLAQARLQHWLVKLLGDDRGRQLTAQLIAGLDADVTVEQNQWLHEVAQGQRPLEAFMERFGHRASNEMELSQPRWREDPAYVTRLLAGFTANTGPSPGERHQEQSATRRHVETTLGELLAEQGGSSLRERIEEDLRQAQRLLPYRELGKFHLMRGYETIRAVLMELGQRWQIGRDVFYLQLAELSRYEATAGELATAIAERKRRWGLQRKLLPADVIDSDRLDEFGRLPPVDPSTAQGIIKARPIATGIGRGTARVVFDPRDIGDLGAAYVLVCPSTDPGWAPLLVNAKGLIVERGGILSHGAIVARDFGIPAVVCEHATRLIADGARVEVDARLGRITLLEAD